MQIRVRFLLLAFSAAACAGQLPAQHSANSNAVYQQLRGLSTGSEVITVNNLELKRDAATFTFKTGNFSFYSEVNGKGTGAVFRGEGNLHVTPPTAEERHNLTLVNHTEEFDEDFNEAVLRFTDSTAAELRKASTGAGQQDNAFARAAQDLQNFMRRHSEQSRVDSLGTFYYKQLYGNLDLRLLQDVLSPASGGYFLAAVHGTKNPHLFFIEDPQGVDRVAPEEVALIIWNNTESTATYPLAFHRTSEYAGGTPSGNEHNASYTILNEDLDVSIEKSGALSSLVTVEVRAERDGVVVIPFDLYPTMRVSQVNSANGDPLEWVQEKKNDDPDFGVMLAAPLKKGESAKLKIAYGGNDVVLNKGAGNYYPVAREDWYPNSNQGLGDYATYHMLFHLPKGLQIVATGTKVNENTDGKVTTSEWRTETPLPVVGFSLGDFKSAEAKLGSGLAGQLTVDAYANKYQPDAISAIQHELEDDNQSLGMLATTTMLNSELSQGQAAAQIYTDYFGPLPFSHIALTQQAACNYGQSWPMLVYLPICGFFDTTQQHFLGLGAENLSNKMYWKVVTPHEVSHQWWGQTVGFRSYRDQWMSEGFADASASIYLQVTRSKPDDFMNFWKEERRMLIEKNEFGFRPIDVGPVTMGRPAQFAQDRLEYLSKTSSIPKVPSSST